MRRIKDFPPVSFESLGILVDPEDHWICEKFRVNIETAKGYVYVNLIPSKQVKLHRMLMGYPKSLIDHINGNKLDNRKSNLRLCTNAQNVANRKRDEKNKSGVPGVHWNARDSMWYVQIGSPRKAIG